MSASTVRAALDTFQRAANRGTAVHLSPELVQELRDALKVEPDAEALAARPLFEQVARLGRLGSPTLGDIVTISNRAAAWLRQNPPGQPVAIEPRGCPTPGACSCVEPASAAPEHDDDWWHELVNEIARVQHVALGEGQGPRFDLAKTVEFLRRPTPPAPEPGEQPLSSLMAQELAEAEQRHGRFDVSETTERLMRCHSATSARGDVQSAALCFRAATLLQQEAAELAALRGVPVAVSERLPEPNTKVLAHYLNKMGKGRTICAIWVPAKTRVGNSDIDEELGLEYDDETDQFYWPEGWYETIENWEEFGYLKVYEGEVAYWQPLPKWPANAIPQPAPQAGEGL